MLLFDRCHVLVLAAGRGTRIGGPKALLDIAGRPWWQHQSAALASVGIAATWVVSDEVRAALASHQGAPPRLVTAASDAPMFASLLAGLRSLPDASIDGVFILPVDTPAPAPAVWHALAQAGGVAIPAFQGRSGHPVLLHSPWVRGLLSRIAHEHLDPNSLRLDQLIAPVARQIPVDDPAVCVNLNTIDDVQAFLARTVPAHGSQTSR